MGSKIENLQVHLQSLPIELRWQICNELLFDRRFVPDLDHLFLSWEEEDGFDKIIKQLQHHAIFSQKRWFYERLKNHDLVTKAVRNRNTTSLHSLRNQSDQYLATRIPLQTLTKLRHCMMHSLFFTEGSAEFLLEALLFLEKCTKNNSYSTKGIDTQLLERMIEYCIKEESCLLLNSYTTSMLARICTGSMKKQLRFISELERHSRQMLFEWNNSDRLQSYLVILDEQANRHTWTQAFLYEMPITTFVLATWIVSELYNRNISFACVKLILLFLLAILGRRLHVVIRKNIVILCYALSKKEQVQLIERSDSLIRKRMLVFFTMLKSKFHQKRHIRSSLGSSVQSAKTSTDARRPLRTAWLNEVMIKNASHSCLIVESYNAADHFFMTHPFARATVQSRQVILISSAWDLRGTRIVVKRCQEDDKFTKTCQPANIYWTRGSAFNIHRKPCLLVPKNGQITVVDSDFS